MTETEFFQKYTGDGSSGNSASSGGVPTRRRTSPLEDYYNEKRQKQAIENANEIINSDILHGGTKPVGWQPATSQPSGTYTGSRGRGNVGGLRDSYLDKHPNVPTMSTALTDDEKFQLQRAYADAANKYKDASKKAQSIRPEEGLDYTTTLEKYRSEQQAATEEKAAAESEMDRLRKQLEFYKVELPDVDQNVFERMWGSVKGGSKQAAGSLGGLFGYTGRVATGGQSAVDKALRASGNEDLSALYHVSTEGENEKAMRMQQAIADKSAELSESGGRDIERSKWGASDAGRFALDAVSQVPALAADMAANALLPGSGMAMMMGRSFGGGVQQAEAGGGNLAQAGAYGAASAAKEYLTEKMFGGLDLAYGKGFADTAVEKLVGKLAKTDIGRTVLRTIINGGGGEFVEEFVSSAVDPTLRAIYNGKSIGENYSEEQVSDWLYDGLVGAALGIAGSGASIATGADAKKNAALRQAEANTPEAKARAAAEAEAAAAKQAEAQANAAAAQSSVADILARGKVNQQQAAAIMNNPEFARAFEALTGRKLSGTTNEMRAEIQRAAHEYAHGQSEQQRQAEEQNADAQRTQAEAERALSEYSRQEAQRDAEWTERRQQMENYGSYESYVRGLIRDGMTPAEAGEIVRNPQMRAAWEQLTGKKLPTDSMSKARSMIMQTREDVAMSQEQRVGNIDDAIELMTGKRPTTEAQKASESQGDITAPPMPSNDAVARPETLNSAVNNNVEVQNADVQKNTAPNGTESKGGIVQRVKDLLSGAKTAQQRNDVLSNMDFGETSAAIESGMVNRSELPFATVSNTTPQVLVDRAGAQNLPIIMDYSSVYLAAKKAGDLPGHYHDLGAEVMAEIPGKLNDPVLMVKLDNGRINEVVQLTDKKGNPILVSFELSTVKNLGGSFNAYNLMLTAFGAKTNYINKLTSNPNNTVLINNMPGATSQVNPQLNKLPGVINEAASGSVDASLDGARRLPNGSIPGGVSSDASEVSTSDNSIPTAEQNVNSGQAENSGRERERGFSKNVRTDNAMESDIRQSFDENPESYSQLANKDTLSKAKEIYDKGLPTARSTVEQALGAAKAGKKLAPEMVPLARMVANELSRSGEVESARNILADVATELTAAGQLGQAGRIMRDSDPNTALRSIEKSLEAINDEFSKQHKHSKWKAELTDAEREKILSTDFTEEGAYQSVYEEITKRIGKEMPSSVFEKLTEIRRINMLLRPKTMIKNVVSNVPMVGLRKGAETLSIGIQSALTKMGAMDSSKRTRGMASKAQKQLANDFYEANKGDINGQSNKWDMKSMLRENRTIFKGGAIEKAMSKMTGKEIQPFGEALRQVTYDLLEKGDAPFVKSAFVDSLSQYCAAKGITSQDGITREAIDFATANAMEATFKNANLIASLINKVKRESSPGVAMAVDVLIPFTTTPANIMHLMGDYSPIGFAKMFAKDGPAAKIDAFSKATVGSAIMALGFALRNADMITGGEDDDKDKAALDKATGRGNYSIGGKVSYDWAQPAGSLLAFGAEIADAIKGQESWVSALMNAIYTAGDSTLNLSLFQNVISVLKGSGKPTQQIIDSIMEGGATQLVPGLAGDIAKIIDGTVRSTYTGGNVVDDTAAKVKAVTPFLSKSLPESVNVKGETNTRGELAERTFNTLINPFNVTRGKRNEVDEEIYRLYDSTGSTTFFPSVSPYSVDYGNSTYKLDGKDREDFQKTQGQTYYQLAKPLLDSEMYKALSDEQKANVLNSIRDYALDAAKRQLVEGRGGEYSTDWDDENQLKALPEFLTAKQALNDGKNGKSDNFDAIDQVLKNFGHLKDDTQTALKASELNVNPLLYAQTKGIKSKSWYDTKAAVDKAKGTLGGTDNAIAIAVYNSMKGKSDAEILDAIRAQVTPKAGGQQSAVVRRAEAYTTVAKGNADLGSWLNLVAALHNADENSKPNKDEVYAAWRSLGLRDNQTYAGITRDDFYNIVKSSGSYATKDDYATQIDEDYAKIDPAVEKERTTFPTTPVTEETGNSKSGTTYTMDDYYRALGLIK